MRTQVHRVQRGAKRSGPEQTAAIPIGTSGRPQRPQQFKLRRARRNPFARRDRFGKPSSRTEQGTPCPLSVRVHKILCALAPREDIRPFEARFGNDTWANLRFWRKGRKLRGSGRTAAGTWLQGSWGASSWPHAARSFHAWPAGTSHDTELAEFFDTFWRAVAGRCRWVCRIPPSQRMEERKWTGWNLVRGAKEIQAQGRRACGDYRG